MKNRIIFCLTALILLLSGCSPNDDHKDIGKPIDPDKIDIEVTNVDGSNEIFMVNNTQGVAPYWEFLVGTSTKVKESAVVPFMGDLTIKFTAIGEGGTTTVERNVLVTKLDKPIPEEWVIFGKGLEGRVWEWNSGDDGQAVVYGTAGYGNNYEPGWSTFKIGGEPGGKLIDGNEEMLFDLDGGANFTKRKRDGTVIEKGAFSFDMSKQKVRSDGKVWSIGEITFTDATILTGASTWSGPEDLVYTFDIITLEKNEDTGLYEMVLAYAAPGTDFEAWNEATFWKFREKAAN